MDCAAKKTNKFSPEVRERAERKVQEQRGEIPSLSAAIESIPLLIGCDCGATQWLRQVCGRHNGGVLQKAR